MPTLRKRSDERLKENFEYAIYELNKHHNNAGNMDEDLRISTIQDYQKWLGAIVYEQWRREQNENK